MREMVDREGFGHAVHQLQIHLPQYAGVGDDHIQGAECCDLARASRNGSEILLVTAERGDPAGKSRDGAARFVRGAPQRDHMSAAQRQHPHGLQADTRRGTGHEDGLAREIQALRDFFRSGPRTERTPRRS